MVQEHVKIEEILGRLYRNPLCTGITLEQVVDYLVDFFRLVGVPSLFDERVFDGEIRHYRCKLPADYHEEIMVLLRSSPGEEYLPARRATDTFRDPSLSGLSPGRDYTFTINNLYLFTSLETGKVKLSYRAIGTDEKGFPLLPGDRFFMEAFENYVKMKYYQVLWESGKLPDKVFQVVQQDYAWSVGKLENSTRMPTLSQMENLKNLLTSLLPGDNEFSRRFQGVGRRDQVKEKFNGFRDIEKIKKGDFGND